MSILSAFHSSVNVGCSALTKQCPLQREISNLEPLKLPFQINGSCYIGIRLDEHKTVLTESARKLQPISLLYESLVIRKYLPTLQLVIGNLYPHVLCQHYFHIPTSSWPSDPSFTSSIRPLMKRGWTKLGKADSPVYCRR